MKQAVIAQIDSLIEEGSKISDDWEIQRWSNKATVFLRTTLGESLASDFSTLDSDNIWDILAMRLGLLQGIAAKASDDAEKSKSTKQKENSLQLNSAAVTPSETRKVFVVHGHDEAAKEATTRFLEKLDMQPIILHEQASGGRTIIEKFEKYSGDVGFAGNPQ
jgi:predicted nucleotide-binding protein